jgi:hypothetical protein
MVNNKTNLDRVFGALGSPVRRAILARLESGDDFSVSERLHDVGDGYAGADGGCLSMVAPL